MLEVVGVSDDKARDGKEKGNKENESSGFSMFCSRINAYSYGGKSSRAVGRSYGGERNGGEDNCWGWE